MQERLYVFDDPVLSHAKYNGADVVNTQHGIVGVHGRDAKGIKETLCLAGLSVSQFDARPIFVKAQIPVNIHDLLRHVLGHRQRR